MANKVYPDWVQAQRTKGTTVKKVGKNYYLYKHSSKRVEGKKWPVPVDTYIGKITRNGVEKGSKKKINTDEPEIIVRELGFSQAIKKRCPQQWKDSFGSGYAEVLDYIIFDNSPETYLKDMREKPEKPVNIQQYSSKVKRFSSWTQKLYGVTLDEFKELRSIYLVTIGKTQMISKISDRQKDILSRLDLELEVP